MSNVIVFGSLNMDLSVASARMPRAGETISGHDFLMNPGGKGANQAVAASRLGADVTMIGAVGADLFGTQLVTTLQKAGVVTDHVAQCDTTSTGAAVIIRTNADNRIILHQGANGVLTADKVLATLKEIAQPADLFITQLECDHQATFAALMAAHELEMYTIFNPAPASHVPVDVLAATDLICVNETECEAISGVMPQDRESLKRGLGWFCERGVQTPLITLGSRGSATLENNTVITQDALPVTVCDTTGAGDTFIGAVAVALTEHKSVPEALAWASCASALACTEAGAMRAIPERAAVDALYREQEQ